MSTFKGVVEEFPEIRIDYFRKIQGKENPLACFLSHVHSDHLQGLESFRPFRAAAPSDHSASGAEANTDSETCADSPFIYCSSATRELLLRLEKYPHRMNFHRGILELKRQHYKHLSKLLKTIALNTPTEIELKLGKSLRVTLLDANHCAGAVMFLIENETKAILYTGDIRSEPWWVNSLVRNPVILPYTHGLKRLDRIYLDTTFASQKTHYRRFPTKADGLKELLEKVSEYPTDTVFHLHAWTFGYEDVWIALSSALRSQIHVDEYKYSLYQSLGNIAKISNLCHEGPALSGFECGNKFQDGCLTRKQNVRLHSCQLDMGCSALEASNIVYIRPIVSRSAEGFVLPSSQKEKGQEPVAPPISEISTSVGEKKLTSKPRSEVGAGGEAEDLNRVHELALNDAAAVESLIELCTEGISDQEAQSRTIDLINKARRTQKMVISLDALKLDKNHKTIPLAELTKLLAKLVVGNGEVSQIERIFEGSSKCVGGDREKAPGTCTVRQKSPRSIDFPFSRHSSYEELCGLVKAFEPVDVYPCTINEDYMDLSVSIASLFGHLCSGSTFAHDEEMEMLASQREALRKGKNSRDLQSMPSSGDRSVDQRGTSPVSLLGSLSDLESYALDDLDRVPKRPRTNPSFLQKHKGDLNIRSLPTETLTPKRQLPRFKQSFQKYLGQSEREKILPTSRCTDAPSIYARNSMSTSQTAIHQGASTATYLKSNQSANTLRNERSGNGPVDAHPRTQAEPIELSDGDPSSQNHEAGDFLLEETPEPGGILNALDKSQLGSETQVTISDTAFESQSPHTFNSGTKAVKVQRRKEAYKAAKEPNGIWEVSHGLISSNAHHGNEEVEL